MVEPIHPAPVSSTPTPSVPVPPAPAPLPVRRMEYTEESTRPGPGGYFRNIGNKWTQWWNYKTEDNFWKGVKSLGAPGALLGGIVGVLVLKPWKWFKHIIAHPIKSLIVGGIATIAGLALWPTLKRQGRRTLDAFVQPAPQFGIRAYNQAQTMENVPPLQALNKLTQEGDFTAVLTRAITGDQNLINQLFGLQFPVEIKPMPQDYRGTEQALYHVEKNRNNGYERKIVYIRDGASPQAVKGALIQVVHGDVCEAEGVFSSIPRTGRILGFGGKKAGMSAEQLVMVSLVSQMAAYAKAQNPADPTSVFNQLASGTYVPPDVLKTMRVNAAVELARAKDNGAIGEGNDKVARGIIEIFGHSTGIGIEGVLKIYGMRMQTAFWKEVQDPNYGKVLESYILKNRPLYDPERRLARLQTSNAVAGQGAAPIEEPATTESLKIIKALGTTKGHYMIFASQAPVQVPIAETWPIEGSMNIASRALGQTVGGERGNIVEGYGKS